MTETTDKTHEDESPDRDLEQAIDAYLLWMKDEGYNPVSREDHKETLRLFLNLSGMTFSPWIRSRLSSNTTG